MRRTCLPLILIVLSLPGCGGQPASGPDTGPTAGVRVEPVHRVDMKTTLEAYGTVGYPPESLRTIDAAAELRVEKVLVSTGESVRAGQALIVARATANSDLELQRARTDFRFGKQELARILALRQQQLATNTEVAAARQAYDNARAALDSITARLHNRNGEILAGKDGWIASVDVQQGDTVAAGASLLHLADRANLRLRLGIEPADLDLVEEGQNVSMAAVYDGKITAAGRIAKLVRQVDPQTRLAEALVDVEAASGLLPGSTVRASIELRQRRNVLAVPRSAVLYSGNRPYVFLAGKGHARQAWVQPGQDDGRRIEIVSGLKDGDQVVVEGNYELEDNMPIRLAAASR